jgi:ADP-ribosylglycohydrolase
MVSAESLARWEASGEPLHCTDDTALTIAVAEELVDVLAAGDELTEGPLLRRLAWVWCGADALPERWLARLPARRHLIELADELAGRAHGRRQASCFVGGAAHVGG